MEFCQPRRLKLHRRTWRTGRTFFIAVLATILGALAACSGSGSQQFGKSGSSGGGSAGRTPPPIALISMEGIPAQQAGLMADAVAEAAGRRDIAIVQGNFTDGYQMSGSFQMVDEGGGARIVYRWTLTGNTGGVLHQIDGQELVAATMTDPWSSFDATVINRIASVTAENLATRLAQLGFKVRQTGMLPPVHMYARAESNADSELDLETYYGPGSMYAAAQITPQELYTLSPEELDRRVTRAAEDLASRKLKQAGVFSIADLMGEEPAPTASAGDPRNEPVDPTVSASRQLATAKPAPAVTTELADSESAKSARETPDGVQGIGKVSIVAVEGSPGRGNEELFREMRLILEKAGWPVVEKPDRNTLSISGKVELHEAKAGVQHVRLAWQVALPDGRVIGTVRQANDVPAGSLNQGWGQTAAFAAEAAASGIFELVAKIRNM